MTPRQPLARTTRNSSYHAARYSQRSRAVSTAEILWPITAHTALADRSPSQVVSAQNATAPLQLGMERVLACVGAVSTAEMLWPHCSHAGHYLGSTRDLDLRGRDAAAPLQRAVVDRTHVPAVESPRWRRRGPIAASRRLSHRLRQRRPHGGNAVAPLRQVVIECVFDQVLVSTANGRGPHCGPPIPRNLISRSVSPRPDGRGPIPAPTPPRWSARLGGCLLGPPAVAPLR
jgi:hypothetical protein